MLSQKIDLMVYGRDYLPFLAVEVKNRKGMTPEQAAEYRRDVIPYLASPRTSYLMLLSQERGYLWRGEMPMDALPMADFPMRAYLRPYLLEPDSDRWLSSAQVEIAVFAWLLDLTNPRPRANGRGLVPDALIELLPSIRGGEVKTESLT